MKPDYYNILGIPRTASQEEIKTAFRRLVMIYHPDKNPAGPGAEEKFRKIMEAYDVLGDEERKKKYDSGKSYHDCYSKHAGGIKKTRGKTKDYSFTEEEYQRRQAFYSEYKKKQEAQRKAEEKEIPSYSDFKYIMISIPLAVGLLFFAINSFRKEEKQNILKQKSLDSLRILLSQTLPRNTKTNSSLPGAKDIAEVKDTGKMKEDLYISPWNNVFGKPVFDSASKTILRVENRSGSEVVVCLTDDVTKKVIRNYFLSDNYYILVRHIPKGKYFLKTIYGQNWNSSNQTTNYIYEGIFDSVYLYVRERLRKEKFSVNDKSFSKSDTITKIIIPYNAIPAPDKTDNHDFFWR